MATKYDWDLSAFNGFTVNLLLKSLSVNSEFNPRSKQVIDVKTLENISMACDGLRDPILFRAIFLTAFFAFFRISNIAPHSVAAFSNSKHLLRKDVLFAPPGAHILQKWSKSMQISTDYRFIQIPSLNNPLLCPVTAIRRLLRSRNANKDSPLFITSQGITVLDTAIREALRTVLQSLGLVHEGLSFHMFRRSGATLAFDSNVRLEHIKIHGGWKSEAVWAYLGQSSVAPSMVAKTFQTVINK